MSAYLLQRLLLTIPILLGIVILTFFMVHLTPGDAVSAMQGQMKMSAQQMEQLREALGLNDPLHIQLGRYLTKLIQGDLGRSLFGGQPVALLIASNIGATVQLTVAAMVVAIVIGVPLGILAAIKRGTLWDAASVIIAMIGVSIPSFWLGLMMIQLFAVTLGWLPITENRSARGLIMPAAALGLAEAAIIVRLTRATMVEILNADYVRTARAKGLLDHIVLWRHALRNGLLPLITMIGMQFGTLLGGAVVIENVFARQGLGTLVTQAVINRDFPVVQGCVLVAATMYVLVNLLVDIMYVVIDPRIRYS
ncbi:MAG: ABC transporter permease [Roseiflexus sp.]|jgi:ABC-type dipeptide/oligopeptide/nickel transport system permease component|nr:ABC transporter permease [Roseiflexus sp.]MBO9366405.1 ABC transporter permease [Roseiflexus sp.]MBO9391103.1 ABC transporter permease [Roseiflexus sp.]